MKFTVYFCPACKMSMKEGTFAIWCDNLTCPKHYKKLDLWAGKEEIKKLVSKEVEVE